jgi:hypothetical protein
MFHQSLLGAHEGGMLWDGHRNLTLRMESFNAVLYREWVQGLERV